MSSKENFENHELPVMVEPRNHLGVPSQNNKELGSRHFCGVPVDSLLLLLHLKTVLDAVYLKAKFFYFYALLIFHKLCMISLKKQLFLDFFMVGLPVVNSSHFGSEIWHVPPMGFFGTFSMLFRTLVATFWR